MDNVSNEVFDEIFRRMAAVQNVSFEAGAAEHLRERCVAAGAQHLRACYPNDIFKLVKAISEYEGRPVRLTKANIDRAVGLYFARTEK